MKASSYFVLGLVAIAGLAGAKFASDLGYFDTAEMRAKRPDCWKPATSDMAQCLEDKIKGVGGDIAKLAKRIDDNDAANKARDARIADLDGKIDREVAALKARINDLEGKAAKPIKACLFYYNEVTAHPVDMHILSSFERALKGARLYYPQQEDALSMMRCVNEQSNVTFGSEQANRIEFWCFWPSKPAAGTLTEFPYHRTTGDTAWYQGVPDVASKAPKENCGWTQ